MGLLVRGCEDGKEGGLGGCDDLLTLVECTCYDEMCRV